MPGNKRSTNGTAKLKIGFVLPTRGELIYSPTNPNFQNIMEMAEIIEELGYDSIWVGDSVTAKPRIEALTTLAAVAARTKTAKLCTSVLLSGLRNPTILAHQIASLDLISSGRVFLGLGLGGGESKNLISEFPACGVPYARRIEHFEKGIEIMKRCWTEDRVSGSYSFAEFDEISVEPKPVQKPHPPIHIAGAHFGVQDERQLRRIAKYGDGFMSTLIKPEEFDSAYEKISRYTMEESGGGGRRQPLGRSLYMTINLNQDRRAAELEGNEFLAHYYGYNFWEDRWGPFGPPDEVIKYIEGFADVGVDVFAIRLAAKDQIGQLRVFTKEVLPSL